MNVLIVIFCLLVLLLLVPVGADVEYCNEAVRAYVRVGAIRICIFPGKPKEKKEKKKKEKQKKSKMDITKDEILDLISVVFASVKKLRFSLHKLKLHFTSAFSDPYQTAMVYGYVSAAVNALGLPSRKHTDIQLGVDFESEKFILDAYLSVTIRIYYIMKLICCLAMGAVPILWRRHQRLKTKNNSTPTAAKAV